MRLPRGCLKSIHAITGILVQELSDYAAARKRPRPDRCKVLERVTGISVSEWLFGSPDDLRSALSKYHKRQQGEV